MRTITASKLARRVAAASALLGVLGATSVALAAPASAAVTPKPCTSATKNISYINVSAKNVKHVVKGAAGCQQANAVTNTWMLRFDDRMQVQRFNVNFIDYRCSLVPTIPRNQQCLGGGAVIRFAAPTGG